MIGLGLRKLTDTDDRKVTLKLSEHDAWQLLSLIKREIDRDDKAWQPYWERLAQCVGQSIEHTAYNVSRYSNRRPGSGSEL